MKRVMAINQQLESSPLQTPDFPQSISQQSLKLYEINKEFNRNRNGIGNGNGRKKSNNLTEKGNYSWRGDN